MIRLGPAYKIHSGGDKNDEFERSFSGIVNSHDGDFAFRQHQFEGMTNAEKLDEIHQKVLVLSYDMADLKQMLASIYPLLAARQE